jgi:hypothetical protein
MGWAKRGRAEHGEGACLAHKLAFDKQAHALGRRDQQLQQQTTHLDVPHGGQSLLTLTQVRICPRCVRPRPSPDTCARTPNGPADSRRTAAPAVYKKARGGAATCPSWPRPAGPTASASVSARYTSLSLSLSVGVHSMGYGGRKKLCVRPQGRGWRPSPTFAACAQSGPVSHAGASDRHCHPQLLTPRAAAGGTTNAPHPRTETQTHTDIHADRWCVSPDGGVGGYGTGAHLGGHREGPSLRWLSI